MNFSLVYMNSTAGYLDYNITEVSYNYRITIVFSFVFLICCIGVPLNGIVIWLLGFQIKRNPFTVLIFNLAIADLGFLLFMTITSVELFLHVMPPEILEGIFFSLHDVTYINGLFLLTAISIDRCVAVLFPIWHRCSRPKHLSSAVCAFLWIFSFLLVGMHYIMQYFFFYNAIWNFHLLVTAVLCLPLIAISTTILFIKICLQSKQMKRGRVLVMILITLLCFLILTLPIYIYVLVAHFLKRQDEFDLKKLDYYLTPFPSLNSSVNPVIYFLVGRKKRARTRQSLKVVFERAFREDETPEIR